MKNLFKPRPYYRICLGFNADYAIEKEDLDARIGTDDPESQIENKYIKVVSTKVVEEKIKDGFIEEDVKVKLYNITLKTKSQFIYHEKEIEEVLEKLYNDLTNKYDKLKDIESGLTLMKIHYFFFDVYKI